MKSVTFSKAGEPTFVALGTQPDGIIAQGPSGQRVGGGPVIEKAGFLRASEAKLFNRGNSTYSNTFSVWRTFPSQEQAEDFLSTQPALLPTASQMVCEIVLNSGAVRYLTTPFIKIQDSSISGVTVRTTYLLEGGKLVNENPYN